VKFIRWVISCSKEWSWILLNLNKHALERVQHVFAVAIYVGSGESHEAPRWVGQSRVGDSAMVGAAKRPTRAMQRPSRPHSMVLKFGGGIDSCPSTVDKDDKLWSGRGGRKAWWRKVTLIPLLKITKPRI
jgi:hypothetical protein